MIKAVNDMSCFMYVSDFHSNKTKPECNEVLKTLKNWVAAIDIVQAKLLATCV